MNTLRIPSSAYDIEEPKSYLKAVSELRKSLLNEKNDLEEKLFQLKEAVEAEKANIRQTIDNDFKEDSVLNCSEIDSNSTRNVEDFNKLLVECRDLSSAISYLVNVSQIETLNNNLEDALKKLNWSSASMVYKELKNYAKEMKKSKCTNLASFVKKTKKAWKLLFTRTLNETVEMLLQLHGVLQHDVTHDVEELKENLNEMAQFSYAIDSNFDNFVEALLQPCRLRFIFHFSDPSSKVGSSGDMKNSKPEWYLSVILKWYQRFSSLTMGFQKLPAESDQITVDFRRGLVSLARERFKFDLSRVAEDDKILPHLIDEAIAFDLELRNLGYLDSDVGCAELLTEPCVFESWLDLEHQQCTKCVETLLADASAWRLRYLEASDLDHYKVPRCTDSFLSLLTAMTQRYRLIRSKQHRMQFVHLQRTLIDDFRMHLFLLTRSAPSPWSTPFVQILNASAYVVLVLSQWQEYPFFVGLEVGVFDELVDLFTHLRRQMLNDAKEAALEDMKPFLINYRKEFSSKSLLRDNALATILVPLQHRLLEVKDMLSEYNFRDWMRIFGESLEKMLIEFVVFEIRVDAKLGEELQTHLAVGLPRVFYSFGLFSRSYFQKLSQCMIVYALNVGGCVLLRESLRNQSENVIENVLLEMGLTSLSAKDVDGLLQRRSDIIMT